MKEKEIKPQSGVVTVPESEIDDSLDSAIKDLLNTCFGWTPEFQERSYWHLKPEARFICKGSLGRVLGHASLIDKSIVVDGEEIKIAGVGAFAVHPEFRDSGIGQEIAQKVPGYVASHGYDLVVAFAKDPTSRHICIKSGAIPTRDMFVVTYPDGGEVLKPHTLVWPLSEEKFQILLGLNHPINLGYGSW